MFIQECGREKSSKTAGWMRHTLIWLAPEGRSYAAAHIHGQPWEVEAVVGTEKENGGKTACMRALVLDPVVPGIVCRQPELKGDVWICGFSHWVVKDGSRHRMLADFRPENVEKAWSPFELCSGERQEALCRQYPKLRAVFSAAENCGVELGLYGSSALEWVTGRPYRHENSDFDLYARMREDGDVRQFGSSLACLEKQLEIRLDVELEAGGYGIKLKELTAPGRTVIGKGLYDVQLFEKSEAARLIFAGANCNLF